MADFSDVPLTGFRRTTFRPAPKPPLATSVCLVFAATAAYKNVDMQPFAKIVNAFVGAVPPANAIIKACADGYTNKQLDCLAAHVWHNQPSWYQSACWAAAGDNERVIKWVTQRAQWPSRQPLTKVYAVVKATLGNRRTADYAAMDIVVAKVSEFLVRPPCVTDIVDQIERVAVVAGIHVTQRVIRHPGEVDVDAPSTGCLEWMLSYQLAPSGVSNQQWWTMLEACVRSGRMRIVKWIWTRLAITEPVRMIARQVAVTVVASGLQYNKDVNQACEWLVANTPPAKADIDLLKHFGFQHKPTALKWLLERDMVSACDIVDMLRQALPVVNVKVVALILAAIDAPEFEDRLRKDLKLESAKKRVRFSRRYCSGVVGNACSKVVDHLSNKTDFKAIEAICQVLGEHHELVHRLKTLTAAKVGKVTKESNMPYVRWAYNFMNHADYRSMMMDAANQHNNDDVRKWLERRARKCGKRQRLF